ncbi:MAG: ABC transporter permease [Actinomycetota bacterium]
MSRLKRTLAQIWPRAAIIAVIVLLWWAVYATGYWDRVLLPSPARVWRALWGNVTGPTGLLVAAERSILRLFLGLAAAMVIGTPIGLAMAAWKTAQRSVGSLMVGLQALPSIAWLPLATLWLGITEKAVFFVVVMGALPAVAIATAASVRLVPPTLTRAARTLGARRWDLYGHVVLPAAVPGYLAGLQQAWALAWRALMAAELLVAGARGLGHFLARAGALWQTPLMLATMVVIMLVGIGVDFLFSLVDRRVRARRGLVVPA